MRSDADVSLQHARTQSTSLLAAMREAITHLRRGSRAETHVQAITSWGIDRHEVIIAPPELDRTFADGVCLRTMDGSPCSLASCMGISTLVLYVGSASVEVEGLALHLARRADSLGPGVRLICVTAHEVVSIPDALIDIDGAFAAILGDQPPPALISFDGDGRIYEIQTDTDAVFHWLINDPRPHSRRA